MPDEMKPTKKPYDPTMSFSFFGSWFDTLERVKELHGVEAAYNFFEAIANYSMYHEVPNFDDSPISYMVWPVIEKEIDISLNRRGANFSSVEAEERRQQVIAIHSENPSLSVRDIAEMTGISKSAVGRIIKSLDGGSITEKEVETEAEEEQERETEKEREQEEEKEGEEDTMGLGRDGTVGQSGIDPLMCSLSDWENLSDEERRKFSLLDRMQARIASTDWVQLEIMMNEVDPSLKAPIDGIIHRQVCRVRDRWKATYAAWLQSITNESAALILEKYLSTHAETATEKMWGDKYGRIIGGWNADKQEPIIIYSATGGFQQGIRHNVASVPVTYYRTEEDAAEVEEERAVFDEIERLDALHCDTDDLPF